MKYYYGNELIWDFVERAYEALEAKNYLSCLAIVDEGLQHAPEDSNLNFIKGVLSQDDSYLRFVDEEELLLEVLKACVDYIIDERDIHSIMSKYTSQGHASTYHPIDTHLNKNENDKRSTNNVYIKTIIKSIENLFKRRKEYSKRYNLFAVIFFLFVFIMIGLLTTIAVSLLV